MAEIFDSTHRGAVRMSSLLGRIPRAKKFPSTGTPGIFIIHNREESG